MRDFLLDTQTVAYWYDTKRPEHATVVGNLVRLNGLAVGLVHKPRLLVSVVTLGEIEYGCRSQVGQAPALAQERRRFLDQQLPECLEVSRDAVDSYGELRARLFEKYAPQVLRSRVRRPEQLIDPATSLSLGIQENDLWLCAQAMGHGLVLVTNDRMNRIRDAASSTSPPLLLQNWTRSDSASISSEDGAPSPAVAPLS